MKQEITAAELLVITERIVRGYALHGHFASPTPTDEDVWIVLEALNYCLFVTPSLGHQAVDLLRAKYLIHVGDSDA